MDRKRSFAVGFLIIAVALGAGHFVQSVAAPGQAEGAAAPDHQVKVGDLALDTAKIELVSATDAPDPAPLEPAPVAAPKTVATEPEQTPNDCTLNLDLVPQDGAMLGITLVAPCHADERVTLSHGGLALTARTTATGSLFTSIPAMDSAGEVAVTFADGTRETAAMPMPELAGIQRFAVQWSADDRFALNAFRNGATYGETGHLTAQPLAMLDGAMEPGAAVMALGDPDVPLPLLAEVYTLPADGKADLTIEAKVTAKTCGRDLIGETLDSRDGVVTVQDLTLAMPGCDAMGDFIVLNNPRPGLKLASSE